MLGETSKGKVSSRWFQSPRDLDEHAQTDAADITQFGAIDQNLLRARTYYVADRTLQDGRTG
jgi:hypothetical protein